MILDEHTHIMLTVGQILPFHCCYSKLGLVDETILIGALCCVCYYTQAELSSSQTDRQTDSSVTSAQIHTGTLGISQSCGC